MLWLRVDELVEFLSTEWPDMGNYGNGRFHLQSWTAKGPAQTADCGRNLTQYKQLIRDLSNDGGIQERYIDREQAGRLVA